jgi:hypothetical protein
MKLLFFTISLLIFLGLIIVFHAQSPSQVNFEPQIEPQIGGLPSLTPAQKIELRALILKYRAGTLAYNDKQRLIYFYDIFQRATKWEYANVRGNLFEKINEKIIEAIR